MWRGKKRKKKKKKKGCSCTLKLILIFFFFFFYRSRAHTHCSGINTIIKILQLFLPEKGLAPEKFAHALPPPLVGGVPNTPLPPMLPEVPPLTSPEENTLLVVPGEPNTLPPPLNTFDELWLPFGIVQLFPPSEKHYNGYKDYFLTKCKNKGIQIPVLKKWINVNL